MKPKIFVTRLLPKPAMEKLKENFEVRFNPHDRVLNKAEIAVGTKWCDVLLCLLTDTIDEEIIRVNPALKGIVNYAVGINNIDLAAATKKKIPVTNTPGVLTNATADLAWSLIFATARRIPESDAFMRAGSFQGWGPMLLLGDDIFGKTLGIVGAGRIGRAVAKRSIGFEMKVLYTDKNREIENEVAAEQIELPELLRRSDFISLHVPLLPETRHLISINELKMMKSTAILINTSRGAVVDEKALVKALQEGWIAAAGLDVYEFEPEMTAGLKDCLNAVILPHLGSATKETRTEMGLICAENAWAIWQGKQPPQIVNPEIYE